MRKLLGFFAVIFLIGAFNSCGDDDATSTYTPSSTSSSSSSSSDSADAAKTDTTSSGSSGILVDGMNGVLQNDVFVGVGENKDNYEEMFDYIVAKNQEALMRMVLDGRVVMATKGTAFTVVDRGFINAKIEIIETGVRGWIPVEYLQQ